MAGIACRQNAQTTHVCQLFYFVFSAELISVSLNFRVKNAGQIVIGTAQLLLNQKVDGNAHIIQALISVEETIKGDESIKQIKISDDYYPSGYKLPGNSEVEDFLKKNSRKNRIDEDRLMRMKTFSFHINKNKKFLFFLSKDSDEILQVVYTISIQESPDAVLEIRRLIGREGRPHPNN